MPFTITAKRSADAVETVRIDDAAAVAKARALELAGWEVTIRDRDGASYPSAMFEQLVENADPDVDLQRNPSK